MGTVRAGRQEDRATPQSLTEGGFQVRAFPVLAPGQGGSSGGTWEQRAGLPLPLQWLLVWPPCPPGEVPAPCLLPPLPFPPARDVVAWRSWAVLTAASWPLTRGNTLGFRKCVLTPQDEQQEVGRACGERSVSGEGGGLAPSGPSLPSVPCGAGAAWADCLLAPTEGVFPSVLS